MSPLADLSVSPVYASIFALMLVAMGADVALLRMRKKIALQGLGEDKHLNRAIRIHGNFAEYVPFAVLLMILIESKGASSAVLHSVGGVLLASRISHWFGLKQTSGPNIFRQIGVILTFCVLIFEAVWLLLGEFAGI